MITWRSKDFLLTANSRRYRQNSASKAAAQSAPAKRHYHTPRPTAIVAAIDLVAFGLLQALLQVGLRVPDDISLVGYDDLPLGRQLSVPLTSIRRPHYDMGLTAAKLLMSAVSGEPLPQRHVVFEPELIAGSSTAVPRPQIRTV